MVMDTSQLWPPSFDAAIFDFDGTLAETSDLWRLVDEAFFDQRGLPYDHEAHLALATLGFAPGAAWCIERYGLDERVEDICDEWNRMGSELYRTKVHLRPGAREYLLALRAAGIPCALATTNDPDVLASMRDNVDVGELFDEVVCGMEVARPKDHPDIYLEAARRLGVRDVSGCMVFEDIPQGISSASRAGMRTCAVRCDDPRQDFSALRVLADVSLDNWTDISLS